ncbi:unnamed protein product [Choristocarpus tenellus]
MQYDPFLKKMMADSNASCMDAALDTLLVYAEICAQAPDQSLHLAPTVIAKGFSGRPGTISRAETALLKLMEVDVPDAVVGALLDGLTDKKPKVPPTCVSTITKALQMFGAKAMPLKEIKSALPGILSHKVVPVRQQGVLLAAELIGWCGELFLGPVLADLRPAQKSEVDNQVEANAAAQSGPRKPTVYLRKDRPKARPPGQEELPEEEETEAFDPKEFIEPVNLLGKLPKTEFSAKTAAKKWSEILEGLNIAVDMIGPLPKLAAGDYGDLIRQLKRLGDHSHVQVAITSHRLLSLMAEGLGPGFSPYCRGVFGSMLQKLKDKKCATALGPCLDRLYGNPLSLDQVEEEITAALDTKKAAHARLATLEWLSRCVAKPKPPVDTSTLATLARAVVPMLGDPDPKIRDGGSGALCMLVRGNKGNGGPAAQVWAVVQELGNTNPRAFKKIKENTQKDSSDPSSSAATAKPPPAPLAQRDKSCCTENYGSRLGNMPPTRSFLLPGANGGVKSNPSVVGKGKPPKKTRPLPKSTADLGRKVSAAAGAQGGDNDDETEEVMPSLEVSMDKLETLGVEEWDEVVEGLKGSAWKNKVAGIDKMSEALQQKDPEAYLGAFVVVLAAHTKSFKDSNMNVLKAALGAVTSILVMDGGSAAARANKGAVSTVLCPAVDKLGDRKLKEPVVLLLNAASEALGPAWVIRRLLKVASQAKATTLHSEASLWLVSCVEDFGSGAVPAPQLISFGVSELDHSNPKVRSSALDLLGCLYHRLGPPMKALLPDLKPALQLQVDDVLAKVGFDPSANAKATRKTTASDRGHADSEGTAAGGLPRVDLTSMLDKDCISRLQCIKGKDAWKGRKAAMEEIIQACKKSGSHLEANKALVELVKALTPRLADSQSNLKPLAANAIAEVVSSVGPDAAPKLTRIYAEPLLGCVADNRKLMRDAAVSALDKVKDEGGKSSGVIHAPTLEALASQVAVALANTVGRMELLEWLKGVLGSLSSGEGSTGLVKPLLSCMQDKSAGVRQLGEECLIALVSAGTVQLSSVRSSTRDSAPAALRQLQPALQRVYAAEGSEPSTDGDASLPSPHQVPATASTSNKLGRRGAGSTATKSVLKAPTRTSRSALSRSSGRASSASGSTVGEESEQGTEVSGAVKGPLLSVNSKGRRLEAEKRSRWLVSSDEPRDHQTACLKTLWSPLLTAGAIETLFPARVGSMECGAGGVELLSKALNHQPEAFLDSLDLIFKWVSLRLCEKENVKAMGQLLELLTSVFQALTVQQYHLEEGEVEAFIPTLLEKSGQAKERFRLAFRQLMDQIPNLYPVSKYSNLLLQATSSKNNRSRLSCLQQLARCMEHCSPVSVLGKKGGKELTRLVDSGEAEVRSAALDVLQAAYVGLERDIARLYRLLGPGNDKTKTLIDERIKAVDRKAGVTTSVVTSNTHTPVVASLTTHGMAEFPPSRLARPGMVTGKPLPGLPLVEDSIEGPMEIPVVDGAAKSDEEQKGRASLGDLLGMGGMDPNSYGIGDGDGDRLSGMDMDDASTDGPFRFDDSPVKVQLSPKRERVRNKQAIEAPPQLQHSDTKLRDAIDAEFSALVEKVETNLIHLPTVVGMPPDQCTAAVAKIKELADWVERRLVEDGGRMQGTLTKHHSQLIGLLSRCLRLSFSCSKSNGGDSPSQGGSEVEIQKQVVAALDQVCRTSPMFFETEALAELLQEVCFHAAKRCLEPSMQSGSSNIGSRDEIQIKLNHIMTASVKADPSVAVSALLNALTAALPGDHHRFKKVMCRDGSLDLQVEIEVTSVYVKLLAKLLQSSGYDGSAVGKKGSTWYRDLDLGMVLRSIHAYLTALRLHRQSADDASADSTISSGERLVNLLWDGMRNNCQRKAMLDGRNLACHVTGTKSFAECSTTPFLRFLGVHNEPSLRRRSSLSMPSASISHSAELARLIGNVSGVQDGREGNGAIEELRTYIRAHPNARGSFEDQVERLRPAFRQFIRDGCREMDSVVPYHLNSPTSTQLEGIATAKRSDAVLVEVVGVQSQEETDENVPGPMSRSVGRNEVEQGAVKAVFESSSRVRLQQLRRRIAQGKGQATPADRDSAEDFGSLGADSSKIRPGNAFVSDRLQPLEQKNAQDLSSIRERLMASVKTQTFGSGAGQTGTRISRDDAPVPGLGMEEMGRTTLASTTSMTERLRKINATRRTGR